MRVPPMLNENLQQYEKVMLQGRFEDTSAAETADILTNLYKIENVSVREIKSVEDTKQEVALGHIVIVPTAGRLLKNPHFTPPGPLYHMVLMYGFDDQKNLFIVNDPGTRRGKGFVYNQTVLFKAIHDWNNGDVLHGKRMMIVVW